MKPYQAVPIEECDEPLVSIPLDRFAVVSPHPYEALGAPYGDRSPYFLRQSVLQALLKAQAYLQQQQPGWLLQIFDAYRPIAVQQFMVDHTFAQLATAEGIDPTAVDEDTRLRLHAQVIEFWAVPSPDPKTPPPHSTGAAVDLTLVTDSGEPVNMGSELDEISPRSYPDHFAEHTGTSEKKYHAHRQLLQGAMTAAGFKQHPNEWWHFSLGDQLWAWQVGQASGQPQPVARYGNAGIAYG